MHVCHVMAGLDSVETRKQGEYITARAASSDLFQ
jgi:hypothetical protein